MKNRDLVASVESINVIAALEQPIRTAFAVALNLRSIQDHLKVYDESRKKLGETYTKKDEDGKPLLVYLPEKDVDGKPRVDALGDAILFKDEDGATINKVNPGAFRLTDPTAFTKDINDLLDIDVTDDVKIRAIKLSDLQGKIAPQHFLACMWMINDDVSEPEQVSKAEKPEKPEKAPEPAAAK